MICEQNENGCWMNAPLWDGFDFFVEGGKVTGARCKTQDGAVLPAHIRQTTGGDGKVNCEWGGRDDVDFAGACAKLEDGTWYLTPRINGETEIDGRIFIFDDGFVIGAVVKGDDGETRRTDVLWETDKATRAQANVMGHRDYKQVFEGFRNGTMHLE